MLSLALLPAHWYQQSQQEAVLHAPTESLATRHTPKVLLALVPLLPLPFAVDTAVQARRALPLNRSWLLFRLWSECESPDRRIARQLAVDRLFCRAQLRHRYRLMHP
ncbi:hypothetical protein D046_0865 [Vibrio parahaemolyticus V-223/04]|nr:hypothetical protein D046_0865 [Vibrio parahaemolyticus V-223/04]